MEREADPLKQWQLSWIDVEGLKKWDEYSAAIHETLEQTNTEAAPWHVINSTGKRRARVNAIRCVLNQLDYTGKDTELVDQIDPKIVGGLEHLSA